MNTASTPESPLDLTLLPANQDDLDFEEFKAAAVLVGDAARDAENWKDVTIHLENAFSHPLHTENRDRFADALGAVVMSGIFRALE